MLEKAVSRLTAPPRRALSITQAGVAAGEDAARQLRAAVRRVDDVLQDVQAMRHVVERLDGRVASLQRQVDSFDTHIHHIESVTETVAEDVKKGTDRLPDPNEGAITKLKSVLSGASENDGD